MKQVEYLEISTCNGLPILHVVIKDHSIIHDGKSLIVREGWLSPFRAYRFQVSGSPDGQWDYGSSDVIGLKHCICDKNETGYGYQSNYGNVGISKQLMLGQIVLALVQWTKSDADLGKYNISNITHRDSSMIEFVDKCYEWLTSI